MALVERVHARAMGPKRAPAAHWRDRRVSVRIRIILESRDHAGRATGEEDSPVHLANTDTESAAAWWNGGSLGPDVVADIVDVKGVDRGRTVKAAKHVEKIGYPYSLDR